MKFAYEDVKFARGPALRPWPAAPTLHAPIHSTGADICVAGVCTRRMEQATRTLGGAIFGAGQVDGVRVVVTGVRRRV